MNRSFRSMMMVILDRTRDSTMRELTRIMLAPTLMGGKPCARGLRVTVGTVVGLVASGYCMPHVFV